MTEKAMAYASVDGEPVQPPAIKKSRSYAADMNRGNNPVALAVALLGAALMIISTLLPMSEPVGLFGLVKQNTLIQHGGWILIVIAIGIAAAALRAVYGSASWVMSLVGSILGAFMVLWWATDVGLRTLYPVGLDGKVDDTASGVVADHGIAIYVAGIGVALSFVGSSLLRDGGLGSSRRKCPECAEFVLADAQVCKHCGYRFQNELPAEPPPTTTPPAKRTVKCHSCGSTQKEAPSVTLTTCESCGEAMKLSRAKKTPVQDQPVDKHIVHCSLCDTAQRIPVTTKHFKCTRCGEVLAAPPPD